MKLSIEKVTYETISVELENCPFCGRSELELGDFTPYVAIVCACGVQGPQRNSDESAADGWNQRKSDNPPSQGEKEKK